jgi:hypothetical protein
MCCVVFSFLFQVLTLEGLSMYWNPQSIFFADKPTEELKSMFKQGIYTKLEQPKGYKYSKKMHMFLYMIFFI